MRSIKEEPAVSPAAAAPKRNSEQGRGAQGGREEARRDGENAWEARWRVIFRKIGA